MALAGLALAGALLVGGCTGGQAPPDAGTTAEAAGSYGRSVSEAGTGTFSFDSSAVLSGNPLKVRYIAPEGGASTADILIVMHGMGRNADEYQDDWTPLVRDRNVLVLVPEFSEDDYPGASYNMGNMLDENEKPLPGEQWTFQVIEDLFDHVVEDVHSDATDYALFGHSAGAQFVHRFVEFGESHRLRIAVAANAGWYTTMDDSQVFPYGLADSPSSEEDMGPALATPLVLLLGADDIDPENDSLRRDAESDAQGINRLQRGINYFLTSREMAADRSLPFDWRMVVMPGIAHEHTDMAEVAAQIIFDDGR
jgi:poly(3-hydroxybutyrate) depolymerase